MTELTLTAPSYAFLQSTMPCWKCSQATSVITVWVPSFIDIGDIQKPDDEPEVGGTSTLRYIHALDDQVAAHVRDVAPWLKLGRSESANAIYWANHCGMCAAIQGDHFVLGVNGPFFPQTRAQADALHVIPGRGSLAANSSAAQSGWMNWIAERMRGGI